MMKVISRIRWLPAKARQIYILKTKHDTSLFSNKMKKLPAIWLQVKLGHKVGIFYKLIYQIN
jgi:hypothetical protein